MFAMLDDDEQLLVEIFKLIGSSNKLKNYCTRSLGMTKPREIVLRNYEENGKQMKSSYHYISLLETLKNFISRDDVTAEIVKDARDIQSQFHKKSYKESRAMLTHPLFGISSSIEMIE